MTAFRKPSHHPSCHMLMRYAAGRLSHGMQLLVASHLAFCPSCRQELQAYEAEAGLALEMLNPEPMDTGCLENLLHKIDEHGPPLCIDVTIPPPLQADERFPDVLHIFTGPRGEKIVWRQERGIEKGSVTQASLRFMHIHAAGHAALAGETGALLLVLEGHFSVPGASYRRGDIATLAQLADRNMRVAEDIMCLIVTPEPADEPSWWDRVKGFFGLRN